MHDISNEPWLKGSGCLRVAFEVGTKRIPALLTTDAFFLSFFLSFSLRFFWLTFFLSLNRTPVITYSFLTHLPCEKHLWWFTARHLALPLSSWLKLQGGLKTVKLRKSYFVPSLWLSLPAVTLSLERLRGRDDSGRRQGQTCSLFYKSGVYRCKAENTDEWQHAVHTQ